MVKIEIKTDIGYYTFDLKEAREIYNQLNEIFQPILTEQVTLPLLPPEYYFSSPHIAPITCKTVKTNEGIKVITSMEY